MPLPPGHKRNFDMLHTAFARGDAALMECQLVTTGEPVAVSCAANRLAGGRVQFVPCAMFFNDNPYRTVNPPRPDGHIRLLRPADARRAGWSGFTRRR